MTEITRLRFIVKNGDEKRELDTTIVGPVEPGRMYDIVSEFHSIVEQRGPLYALVDFLSVGDFWLEGDADEADAYWSYALGYDNQMDDPLFAVENMDFWKEQKRLSEWTQEDLDNEVL